MATVDDLYDALEQLARRGEASPGDAENAMADARRAAAERHKSSRGLWRAIAAAAAVVLLVAAVVAIRDGRDAVTTIDVPTSSLLDGEASGAFDRGRNDTLVLDPDTDERLRGVVVASLDGEADAVAVAADGAVGLLEGATLRIVADGEQIARRELDGSGAVRGWGRDSIAFDTEGTLWVWTGGGVAGLRNDGTSVDVDDVVPPISSRGGRAGLRINGVNVSVVLYDLERPSWAEVVAAVGDDPLEGVRTVDTPVTSYGSVPHPGTPYLDGPRAVLTSEVLLSGSIVGSTRAELDWTDLPSDADGYEGATSDSPIVADTAVSLLSMSIYDGSFLVVDRSDGASAVAIVAAGADDQVSVSPDGAVHLATIADGTTTVRTLLDADLRPLAAPSVDADDGASAASETGDLPACGEPAVGDQVVDDVDLDDDGALDRVTLDEEGLILACLADGTRSAVAAFPVANVEEGPTQTLSRVDLGGIDGVMVTLEPGPEVQFHVQNYLLHLHEGMLSVVGSASVSAGGLPDNVYGVDHVGEGWDFPTGPGVDQGTPGSFGVIGCRPAVLPDTDFDVIVLIHDPGTDELYAEVSGVTGEAVYSLDSLAPDLVGDLPRVAARDQLDSVLRDAGFSPGCRPIGPDDEPVATTPTLPPPVPSAACDDEQEWDTSLDLDADGEPDRVTLASRGVDAWGLLVACLADDNVASLAVAPGPAAAHDGWVVLEPLDLAGRPGIAMVRLLGAERDFGEYEVFVLHGEELVALTPNDTSGRIVEGVLEDLRLFGNTRVETFGCRSRADGRVDFLELLIERVDSDVTTDADSPTYTGERLAVSYVVRTSDADWAGIGEPGDRVALPAYDGGTARPDEILEDLGATWLCKP